MAGQPIPACPMSTQIRQKVSSRVENSAADQGTATPDRANFANFICKNSHQEDYICATVNDEFELRMLKSIEVGDQGDRHMQFLRAFFHVFKRSLTTRL